MTAMHARMHVWYWRSRSTEKRARVGNKECFGQLCTIGEGANDGKSDGMTVMTILMAMMLWIIRVTCTNHVDVMQRPCLWRRTQREASAKLLLSGAY